MIVCITDSINISKMIFAEAANNLNLKGDSTKKSYFTRLDDSRRLAKQTHSSAGIEKSVEMAKYNMV